MKLGSLFDGIGGFPYSATQFGIETVWASEIETWPIKVTQHHFPKMKHLGRIQRLHCGTYRPFIPNGKTMPFRVPEVEPVDVITFGSPCQDLSVAGKRDGLEGERSGLFMEAIRIIREMREATHGLYPRFIVWENVPGAFSSNGGQDFRAVLEAITNTAIPMPVSGGWADAGMVRTGSCDLAWRTLDAQYWGVPQRRKRIFLVADFGGQCAGEILFNEEGLRRYITESRRTREEAAATIGEGAVKSIGFDNQTGHSEGYEISPAIRSNSHGSLPSVATYWDGGQVSDCLDCSMLAKGQMIPEKRRFPAVILENHPHDSRVTISDDNVVQTLTKKMGTGGGNVPMVMEAFPEPANSLMARGQLAHRADTDNLVVAANYTVRRLTPLECLRLQGYPDRWLDIDKMSDTAKFKAIGNSVAIPCVVFIIGNIARVLKGKGAFND